MADYREFTIYTLPGWQGSGADHWQTYWEQIPGIIRLQQDDWDHVTYADWKQPLAQAVAASDKPVVLIAHSLATSLVTRWAIESGAPGVAGALLVATTDRDRFESDPAEPQGFAPMLLRPLPFTSTVIASTDDPRCAFERSRQFADAWGSEFIEAGALGHIGSSAGLENWPQGLLWLGGLIGRIGKAGA